jgi:thiol:disulfide interchange protein DsbD
MRFSLFPMPIWLRMLAPVLLAGAAVASWAAEEFLEPEQAFKVSARALDERTVEVAFTVAPGYYLYREQFRFVAPGATLGTPALPSGKVKFDQTFRKDVETYRDVLRVALPVLEADRDFRLIVTSQGCADAGLCYPPMQTAFKGGLVAFGGSGLLRPVAGRELEALLAGTPTGPATAALSTAGRARPAAGESPPAGVSSVAAADESRDLSPLGSALREGRFWTIVGVFFGAGLLLSLTPCVLPMLPIISSIIAGHGTEVSRGRGLALAATYSLGMALVYTALGVGAGLAGEGLAAALQTPAVLAAFAIGLVTLSLSMFGAYELRLPAALTTRMTAASHRLPAGRLAGVLAMGGVSALIVSPCVAAPLAGALVYLSQTRDVWLGGTALFSLAAGMSVPLLLVGASAGALLPRAGAWMVEVKRFFGLLLLAVALYTVQTVLPVALALALWGALGIAAAATLAAPLLQRGTTTPGARIGRLTIAAVLAVAGLLELVGAASGGADPLQPLVRLRHGGADPAAGMPRFLPVRNVDELDAALRSAGRPVIVDFYADWCVSCKEMERFTFTDPEVQRRLGGALLLKADVTANNVEDRALLKRFHLFGPPGTIFFDAQGREVAGTRVIGFQSTRRFLETLRAAGL